MCSEAVWWRCHRRLVSDYMTLVLDQPVKHLMPNGNLYEHKVTEGATLHGDHLIYDGGQSPLGLVNSTTTP